MTPTIILKPARNSGVLNGEIFGPILPIITFSHINEVIEFINSKPKPLAIYYFGLNSFSNENLIKVKDQTSSGAFDVNECAMHYLNNDLGFGGVGASG